MLLDTHQAEIAAIIARYAHPQSAVLPLLYLAQDTYGHLSDAAIREVADILAMPPTAVFQVVGFYTLFHNRPIGRWMLQVCDDVPCCYLGAEELLTALKQALGIAEEQTTPDGMFTLQRVKCLAACNRAPVLQANLDYVYAVTPDRVNALLISLRERATSAGFSASGRNAEDYAFDPAGKPLRIERKLGSLPVTPTEPPETSAADAPPASVSEAS